MIKFISKSNINYNWLIFIGHLNKKDNWLCEKVNILFIGYIFLNFNIYILRKTLSILLVILIKYNN